MDIPKIFHGQGSGSDVFFRLGFAAGYVRFMALADSEDVAEWMPPLGNADVMEQIDSTGVRSLDASEGISWCIFDDTLSAYLGETASTPADTEDWTKANGIRIDTATLGLADGIPFTVIVFPMSTTFIRGVHDGGDNCNTYFEDGSQDFKDLGVEGGQNWILINESNDNYAYVKSVAKPVGSSKYCRLYTAENSAGDATAAADFDDNDVIFLIRKDDVQYPLSGIGAMT